MHTLRQHLTNQIINYNPELIQTAVSVIINNDQILLIKRKVNSKDLHSGQIAFPGGKLENNENTLQAAIRETREEIGLQIDENHHLGRMPNNYLAYYIKNKSLKIAAHIFVVNETLNLCINPTEVDRIIMLPIQNINLSLMAIRKHKIKSAHIFARSNERQQYISDVVMKGFRCHQLPYFELESQIFYGLSWLVMCDILRRSHIHQDVVDYTFNNYHYEFDDTRKEQFFDAWFKKNRLNQFYI